MLKNITRHGDLCRLIILFVCALLFMSCFVFTQPFGDGPDEINRYKVVSYIENHGTIPTGDNPEIIIDGYGASYAFQPILTYMLEGYILFVLKPLALSAGAKLVIARFVNVLIGLVAAFYTWKLSLLLFKNKSAAYLFTLGVVLLPQNIFIFTYVNTDGMGLLSCIMILYSLLKGIKTSFDKESVLTLAIGIILCLLSYYNCYGYVLVAFLAFMAYAFTDGRKNIKDLLKKAGIIALISILGAGWWFIRNMILYSGDIFAMAARQECAADTGNWYFLEQMANTYQAQGYSLYEMIFNTDYYTLVWKSFIGMFGPMSIPTSHHLYMMYKYLTAICLIGFVIAVALAIKNSKWLIDFGPLNPHDSSAASSGEKCATTLGNNTGLILTASFILLAAIPVILTLYYSYTWDFQPQGRYYLPILAVLAFVLVKGLETLILLASKLVNRFVKKERTAKLMIALIYHLFYLFFFGSAALSTLIMLNYYDVI